MSLQEIHSVFIVPAWALQPQNITGSWEEAFVVHAKKEIGAEHKKKKCPTFLWFLAQDLCLILTFFFLFCLIFFVWDQGKFNTATENKAKLYCNKGHFKLYCIDCKMVKSQSEFFEEDISSCDSSQSIFITLTADLDLLMTQHLNIQSALLIHDETDSEWFHHSWYPGNCTTLSYLLYAALQASVLFRLDRFP